MKLTHLFPFPTPVHLFPSPAPVAARPAMVWAVSAETGRPVCSWHTASAPAAPAVAPPAVADPLAALIARHRSLRAA